MTPLRLTREEVEALGGHTPGPWEVHDDEIMGEGEILVSGYIVYSADHDLFLASPALRADLLTLHDEVERLRAELAKPVAEAWRRGVGGWVRHIPMMPGGLTWVAFVHGSGWRTWDARGEPGPAGPESGDAGRRAADLALSPFYRLVGGVFGGEP